MRYVRGLRIFDGNEGDILVRGPTQDAGEITEGGDVVMTPLGSLGAGMVPTYIGPSESFTIPANRQALYAVPIENDGTLIVDGSLIEVD